MSPSIPARDSAATLLALGASHHTSSVASLESFARSAERFGQRFKAAADAASEFPMTEMAVLATCNRVEVYVTVEQGRGSEAASLITDEVFTTDASPAPGVSYQLRGPDAVRHLARVAAGLDSVVVGEHQISGQVKRAFDEPLCVNGQQSVLSHVGRIARAASGRVRAETALGRHSASLGTVARDLAKDELGGLEGRNVLVVGAGKMGGLVCSALRRSDARTITVANRSAGRAEALAARIGAQVASLGDLPQLLAKADVAITATAADAPTIDIEITQAALEKREGAGTLLLIDLAIPRDVDPAVGELPGIRVLTLDDVKTRLDRHISLRLREIGPAEAVVDEVVDEYLLTPDKPEIEALIGELRRHAERVRDHEVKRWLDGGEGPTTREDVDRLTRSLVNKLLHMPMVRLRAAQGLNGRSEDLIGAVRELFDLTERDEQNPPE